MTSSSAKKPPGQLYETPETFSSVSSINPQAMYPNSDPSVTKRVDMKYLVKALVKYSASDLHIKPGRPPLYRVNGKIIPAKMPDLSADQVQSIIFAMLNERQMHDLHKKLQIDFSFRVGDLGRFRCNAFHQRGMISAVIRMIPMSAKKLEDLGVPSVVKELAMKQRGLVLVTGSTGSGKSTTLAAMINYISTHRPCHILTIEDPIEFMFHDNKATITQREIGADTHSFKDALLAGLRQDPDVIMVGEMRDAETIQTVLTAAETGHLVLATLHTHDAKGTIDRILDVVDVNSRNQVRLQLASVLLSVISQRLLSRADGNGRVAACEIMVRSPAIEQLILKNELENIPELIASSNNYYKMQTINQDLVRLVSEGLITEEEAVKASSNPDDLRLNLSGVARESYHSN
jgi:twitching motility protein PilT